MAYLTRTLEQHHLVVSAVLAIALALLLVFSPAEASLGNVVKIVYAHGAAERVSSYAYLIAAGVGLVQLVFNRTKLVRWTRAISETAIVLWVAQFVISLPAQVLAWGGLTLSEPRVAEAMWILGLTLLIYGMALWIGEPAWMALAAVANAVIVVVILRGAINILHPLNPIVESDSMAIKAFYAAIVLVTGALAVQFARYCGAQVRGESYGSSK